MCIRDRISAQPQSSKDRAGQFLAAENETAMLISREGQVLKLSLIHILDEPKDILMEKLRLTNNGYLTNAAMLLFSKDPQQWLQGAYAKIGFFETDEMCIRDRFNRTGSRS